MEAGIDTSPYFTVRYDNILESYPNFTKADWDAFVNYIGNEMDEYLYQFDEDGVEEDK